MAKIIRRIVGAFRNPCGFFSIRAGERRYTPPRFEYPSIAEAWRRDWENIGGDFRRACGRLEAEFAR